MRQDERRPFDDALASARASAYPPGEYIGQESFMTAGEIRDLGAAAGIRPGARVLDVCCGAGGPGRVLAGDLGARVLGIDSSGSAVGLARERAGGLDCRYVVGCVPPLPDGSFDVVVLLETMLAFRDKRSVLSAVAGALAPGGRFAFTVEAGPPLSADERAAMPDADTVWPVEMDRLREELARVGLAVVHEQDLTAAHAETATALCAANAADAPAVAERIGGPALDDLLAAHHLWCDWLGSGRIRKVAVVARRTDAS